MVVAGVKFEGCASGWEEVVNPYNLRIIKVTFLFQLS